MQFAYPIVLAFSVISLAPVALCLGINCRGGYNCAYPGPGNSDVARQLVRYIDGIENSRFYNNGEQIACVIDGAGTTGYCAFWQKTNGLYGGTAKQKAHYITDHGCKICGSVPLDYPNTNDVEKGMLTFNAVAHTCRADTSGLCP